MKQALVYVKREKAALLIEHSRDNYELIYEPDYNGAPVSLSLPVEKKKYVFKSFPAYFEGLLPEGVQLEALLRQKKIDKNDLFSQLMAVGEDMVGAVPVEEIKA